MLTQEQIKKLNPGDSLIIHGEYIQHLCDGDIVIKCNITRGGEQTTDRKYFHPSCVSLPSDSDRTFCHVVDNIVKPKHDPARLFKKGDKVRPVKRRGRYYSSADEKYADLILTVKSDEVTDSSQSEIWVEGETEDDKVCWNTDPVYLELVTPVEELVPFYVDYITEDDDDDLDDNPRWCVKYRKYDDIVSVFYRNGFEHPEKTQAAAEAECKRLNEEHRKNH